MKNGAWARLESGLGAWLFQPGRASHLGIYRILFFTHLYVLFEFGVFSGLREIGNTPEVLYQPPFFFPWLGISKPGPETMAVLTAGLRVALLLACSGLFTRTSMTLSFALSTYLFGMAQCFGKVGHGAGMLVVVLGILAFSRAGDSLSVDAVLRARLRLRNWDRPRAGPEYGWPFKPICVLHALGMMAAGLSKLSAGSSGGWFGSEGMSYLLKYHHYVLDPPTSLGLSLAKSPLICLLFALGTVTAELFAPAALFVRRLRLPLIGTLFLMQLGIALLLGVHSNFPWLMLYLAWIPLGKAPFDLAPPKNALASATDVDATGPP